MPRKPITREKILASALDLVDREGLDAVSMRRVGERLGIEAMSLYNHVPNKAAILDGVFEAVLAELAHTMIRGPWKAVLRDRAEALRAVLLSHPRVLPLFASRPAVTPGSLAHVETVLDALHRAKFDPSRALSMFQVLVAFVVGHCIQAAAPLLEDGPAYERLDATRYPRILEAARWGRDLEAEFALGLDALLAGFPKP